MAVKKKKVVEKASSKTSGKKIYGLAIVAFVFSLLFFIPFAPLVGLALGIVALVNIQKKKLGGKGLAIAAIIISVLFLTMQIAIFAFVYSFVSGINILAQKSPTEGINYCIENKNGIQKDMCIFFAISLNINNTQGIDKNVCDSQVENEDLRGLCNAVLKRDKTYCDNIKESESRIKCYGIVDELGKMNVSA